MSDKTKVWALALRQQPSDLHHLSHLSPPPVCLCLHLRPQTNLRQPECGWNLLVHSRCRSARHSLKGLSVFVHPGRARERTGRRRHPSLHRLSLLSRGSSGLGAPTQASSSLDGPVFGFLMAWNLLSRCCSFPACHGC